MACGDDPGRSGGVAGLVNGGLLRCGHGGVHDGAGRAGEGDLGLAVHLVADAVPCLLGALLGDADQQQREPADEHVGPDAVFQAVEHRAQQQGGFEVPEPALGLQQVLVRGRDFGRGQVLVGGGQQVLAVQLGLGGDRSPVDDEPAGCLLAQVAAQGAMLAQGAFGAGMPSHLGLQTCDGLLDGGLLQRFLGTGTRCADAFQLGLQSGDGVVSAGLVLGGLSGVPTDDPPHPGRGLQRDFFDLQIPSSALLGRRLG